MALQMPPRCRLLLMPGHRPRCGTSSSLLAIETAARIALVECQYDFRENDKSPEIAFSQPDFRFGATLKMLDFFAHLGERCQYLEGFAEES